MKRYLMLMGLLSAPAIGQIPGQLPPSGGNGGAAGTLAGCVTSRTSGSVLTLAASSSVPCKAGFGSQQFIGTSPVTINVPTGTGTAYIYMDESGEIQIAVGSATGGSCSGGTYSCTLNSLTTFPSSCSVFPIWTWPFAAGSWATTGAIDSRNAYLVCPVTGGAGITITGSPNGQQVSLNPLALQGASSGQYSGASATYTTAAPYYFPAGGGLAASTTTSSSIPVVAIVQGSAGVISAFSVTLGTAPSTGTSTFTWFDGSTSQAVTCSITGAAKTCSDTTHNFAFSAGDLLSVQMTETTASVTTTVGMVWGTGQVGPAGATGATGSQGSNGSNGTAGPTGATGATGVTGSAGAGGSTGQLQMNNGTGGFSAAAATDNGTTIAFTEPIILPGIGAVPAVTTDASGRVVTANVSGLGNTLITNSGGRFSTPYPELGGATIGMLGLDASNRLASVALVGATYANSPSPTLTITGGGGSGNVNATNAITDVTTIQAAITAATSGGTIFIGPLTTNTVGTTISVTNPHINVVCLGPFTSIKGAAGLTGSVFSVASGADHFSLSGCAIDTSSVTASIYSVLANSVSNFSVTNNTFIGNSVSGSLHVYMSGGVTNFLVQNNTGTAANGVYGQANTTFGSVSLNNFKTPGTLAVAFHSTTASEIVSHIDINDNVLGCGTTGCIEVGNFGGNNPTDITIRGNVMTMQAADGFCSSMSGATSPVVTGNTCDANGFTPSITGFEFASGGTGGAFTGNKSFGAALSITDWSSLTASANEITPQSGVAGIFVEATNASFNTSNNIISHNTIHGNGGTELINLQCNSSSSTCNSNQIIGNQVLGSGAETDGILAVNNTGTMTGNVVSENTISNVTTRGVYWSASTGTLNAGCNYFTSVGTSYVTAGGTIQYNCITSLTTTGTSGPATQTAGVLNIPQYSGGGNVSTSGSPAQHEIPVWASGTTILGIGPGAANAPLLGGGASADPAFSSILYPTTATTNNLIYASSATQLAALATANNGVLVTSSGGAPSISTTLPTGLAMQTPASLVLTNATGLPAAQVDNGCSVTGTTSMTITVSTPQATCSISFSSSVATTTISGTATNQLINFAWTPGANSLTIAAPANFGNWPTAIPVSGVTAYWSCYTSNGGTNWGCTGASSTASYGMGVESSAAGTPASGEVYIWNDLTDHSGPEAKANGSTNVFKMFLTGIDANPVTGQVTNGSHITNSSIPNTGLANPSLTINGASTALGASSNANWTTGAITSTHVAQFTGTSGELQDGGVLGTAAAASTASPCSGGQFSQGWTSGSNNCATPSGSGNVSNTGTPTNGQIAQWTSATVIQGITSVPISAGGLNATSAAAGTIPNASSTTASSWTATPTLGVASTTTGSVAMESASNAFAFTIAAASGMSASNTIVGPSAVPTNNHLLSCSTTSTTCQLTDSGVTAGNVVNASSPGVGIAHFAGSTQTVTSSTIATGDIAANAVTSAKEAVVNTYRQCDMAFGDTSSSSALTNAQLGPQVGMCFIPAAATVVEIDVRADGGTPNIIVAGELAGTVSNLVSGALATAASGARACSKTSAVTGLDGSTTCSATLQNTSLAAGTYLQAVSGTAGGTAKWMTVHVVYTVN